MAMVPPSCLNCRAPLVGPFCAQCGQEAKGHRVSFGTLVGEWFDEALNLDSKVARSVRLLFFSPGVLSLEYLQGRRAAYMRPFRVFLLSTALFFLVPAFVKPGLHWAAHMEPGTKVGYLYLAREDGKRLGGYVGARGAPKADGVVPRFMFQRLEKLFEGGEGAAATRFNDALGSSAQKAMFLLVPIFALLLKLLYLRQPFVFVEHFVVALHFNSVLFLTTLLGLYVWRVPWLLPVVALAVAVHLFLLMQRVYRQRVAWTAIKFVVLAVSYGFALSAALTAALLEAMLRG